MRNFQLFFFILVMPTVWCFVFYNIGWSAGYKAGLRHQQEMSK